MANPRRIAVLLVLVVLPVFASGCHLPKHAAVPVKVIDAETKAPIPGATVRLWSPDPRAPSLGKHASGVTSQEGITLVRSEAGEDVGLLIGATAPGYLSEQTDFRTNISSTGTVQDTGTAGEPVIELYSGPRPTVEIVVPVGYRGTIKTHLQMQEGPVKPGQRSFQVEIDSKGDAVVIGPPVLKQGLGPDYRARFADGKTIPMKGEGLEIAFRWLSCKGDEQIFVVGTQADWNEAHRSLGLDTPPPRSSGGGGGGKGGGGGGRHGGGGGRGGGGSATSGGSGAGGGGAW